MKEVFKYLPPTERKKILLICDDIRVNSGVATVAREIVIHTAQHFNWVQIAGAIQHPDKGRKLDLSKDTNIASGIEDSSVIQYPTDGYGNPDLLRQIIEFEKPTAIMLFTDPRYFTWVFNMENEIRKHIPIIYLNIWDSMPAPMYNAAYYESCDLLLGISKQTVNINKIVLEGKEKNRLFKYLPHGLNDKVFYPIQEGTDEMKECDAFKNIIFKNKEPKFVAFLNSRNLRRKQIPDLMLAFKFFLDSLPYEEAQHCFLMLHTELSSEVGTNLMKVKEFLFGEHYNENVIFSFNQLSQKQLNYLYNIADVQVLPTSNEGWGLSLTEALLSGTPIIANVTGGMQDQMRFEDSYGDWVEFDKNFTSNHFKTYTKCGAWAFPVFPSNMSMQGSPVTPYIFDDRCDFKDIASQLGKVYLIPSEKRKQLGLKGREWATGDEAGFTSKHQAERFITYVDELFQVWEPKEKYEVINTGQFRGNFINHSIIPKNKL